MNYGFARTVRANIELSKICPGHDLTKLGELFQGSDMGKQYEDTAKIILILNEAYEEKEKFNNPEYKGNPLTMKALMNMDDDVFNELSLQALEVYSGDSKQEVGAEPKKEESQAKK